MSTIVVGVHDPAREADAIAFARRIAALGGARVILANVYPYDALPVKSMTYGFEDLMRSDSERLLAGVLAHLDAAEGVEVRAVPGTSAAHGLHELAEAERADLLVVGSTGRGPIGRVVPGATAVRLLHGACCSVAVVPRGWGDRRWPAAPVIGCGHDGSEGADHALAGAAALARAVRGELVVVRVFAPELWAGTPALVSGPGYVTTMQELERIAREGLERTAAAAGATAEFSVGSAAEVLARRSSGFDALVLGSRGYGPLRTVLLGGVAGRVVREAACPVIVTPRGVERPFDELVAEHEEVAGA